MEVTKHIRMNEKRMEGINERGTIGSGDEVKENDWAKQVLSVTVDGIPRRANPRQDREKVNCSESLSVRVCARARVTESR